MLPAYELTCARRIRYRSSAKFVFNQLTPKHRDPPYGLIHSRAISVYPQCARHSRALARNSFPLKTRFFVYLDLGGDYVWRDWTPLSFGIYQRALTRHWNPKRKTELDNIFRTLVTIFFFSSEALRSYHGRLHTVAPRRVIAFPFFSCDFSLISSLPLMRFNRQTSISINFPRFGTSNSAECHYRFRNSWLAIPGGLIIDAIAIRSRSLTMTVRIGLIMLCPMATFENICTDEKRASTFGSGHRFPRSLATIIFTLWIIHKMRTVWVARQPVY